MLKPVNARQDPVEQEKEILAFWKEQKIFERSIQNRADAPAYSFFDGPPFVTGVPHYGTILSSVAKDVVPRYWTMKGFRVDRRWGWDCHGLPVEHLIEKKLKIQSKKEIEAKIGIEKFNNECRLTANTMAEEWEEIIERIGRWVDYKNAYRTMDKDYMESVWWAFKEMYTKSLIYEDTRISLYCPRCSTPLSNFEIAMDDSYEDVSDTTVFVKFKIQDGPYQDSSLLVWTTTPWTLPANTALAVNKGASYVRVKSEKRETLIIAKDRIDELTNKYAILEEIKGADLEGASYIPPYPEYPHKGGKEENLHRVYAADFVSTEEGTGVVHIAPAFGEDDFKLSKEKNLPVIENIDEEARYIGGKWEGENVWEANQKIVEDLGEKKILYKSAEITHSYPFCYRCHSRLIYKTQPAWFINISKIKDTLIVKNEEINWRPKHLKHGRFLKGIETAPDWNISRDRYWGTAIPVWRCEQCKKIEVVGSYDELYQLSGQKLEDYHRPYIDEIDFVCECGGKFKRIPQILDCWFESGSMPYAERHYPFENKEDFAKKFPADFISEYIAQTRAWFYVLHVLAAALFDQPAFKNVVTTGVIAGEDGRKMSKSLGNYTDPHKVLDTYGGDALRFYLMSSSLMEAENLSFSIKDLHEIKRGMIATLWNSYSFFVTYALLDKYEPHNPLRELIKSPVHVLDRWILSELHILIAEFEKNMDDYQIAKAARLLPVFVDKLSNWYIRRSRKRFWKSENDQDKTEAYITLSEVLIRLSQIAAPFLPFLTESIYRNITGDHSVHLTDYPKANKKLIDEILVANMEKARTVVKLALALRAEHKIKVRQPLGKLVVDTEEIAADPEISLIICEEVNVKEVVFAKKIAAKEGWGVKSEDDLTVGLHLKITSALQQEGDAREIVRNIQEMRKRAGYEISDRIIIGYAGADPVFNKFGYVISKETLAEELTLGLLDQADAQKDIQLSSGKTTVAIRKIDTPVV